MNIALAKGRSAREAIDLAMGYFQQFYSDAKMTNVLLEELNFEESEGMWEVTIGFDIGRKKVKEPTTATAMLFGDKQVEPIREARKFLIDDNTGGLVSMVDV